MTDGFYTKTMVTSLFFKILEILGENNYHKPLHSLDRQILHWNFTTRFLAIFELDIFKNGHLVSVEDI